MKMDSGRRKASQDEKDAVLARYVQRKKQLEKRTHIAVSGVTAARVGLQNAATPSKQRTGMPQKVAKSTGSKRSQTAVKSSAKKKASQPKDAARAVKKITDAVKETVKETVKKISKAVPMKRKAASVRTPVPKAAAKDRKEASKRPAPVLEDGEEQYTVEALRNHGWAKDEDDGKVKLHYQVKWLGYPEKENTWSTAEQLREDLGGTMDKLVNEYRKRRNLRKDFDTKGPK